MKDNIEKLLKRFLKRKVKITVATTVTFLLTGIASYSEEIKLTDTEYQKYFFSKVEKDNKIKGILNFFGIIEKQKYDTYSSSKMLERWDKYDPTGNYEENPVKNTEKNIISKKENDKKISNNGEITGDRTQLNNTIEISTGGGILIGKSIVGNVQNQELIAINGLDNSISNISKVPEKDVGNNGEITEGENIGNINKDSIKVDPDKKEEIEIEGGNISSEDVNEVGTTGDSGKNGANGNEGGRYEHGEAGGSGTNGGSVTGKKDITINKDNITVTGGQGGLGGTGGKGGDDWGHGGNAGTGGAGGNGGIGGSATGIQTNGDITNIGDITVIAGIGGTGGTGGNGGDDKYTHTWGGKGGTGGDGGTAIGIETSDGTIKNQGSIIAIGGNAGTGGQGGHWGGNKGPDAEDGKNGINGNGIGIKGDNNTIFNEGTLIGSNTAVSGNNNNITNIGIIGTGTGNDIITGTGNNLINAGVTVKVDNTGKITSIIESSENTKVEINGKNYTSIHMKNEIGNQSNKIINATNDTKHLIIGQDTTIKDSIVNGVDYDNASIIVNKGTTKIEGTTINSLNDNAIKINDETTLIFSGSFADGNIDLSNGNNSLIFSNGSSLTGKIETGTGNNELIFDKAKYELELDLSKGNDNITIKNGSLLGEIKLGEGNNKVVIENAEYNKNLDMTKGDDELYLQNGGIYTGKIDFGEGNNKLIINNTSINNNFDLANGNNEIKTINTILEGNLTAGTGNDNITLETDLTAKNNKYFDLNITLGNDNSNEINNLKIGSNNYLDGIVKGSLGKDNIMIGNSDTGTNIINLELSGIENVTLQGNTKISANSKLYADKITVTGSGDTYLELDVDINKNAGIHTGHGLYGNTGIYETLEKDSHLIIDTSKINNNSIIDITGDLKIENDQLKSDSLIHSVFKNKDGDIEVIVDHSLPPINGGNGLPAGGIDGSFIRYDELNQVYQSIYTAGKIGYLAQDVNLSDKEKDEAFKSLLSFLNQIYANNIYGYAPKLSIDSMDLYKKSILNTSNKLSKDDVLVKGTFLYAHREKQNDTHGRNFYGWDNGIERFNVSTNTEGLMTSIEKGLTENQTIGIDFGASKQQSKISNSSTLDANSLYLGVHNIYEKGMFKAVFGVGMQTNMYEGERVVKTKYSFSKNNTDFSTLSHNIYLDTSYNFKLNNNVSLIPYYDFTTNIVHMESIKENYTDSSLAISTDKEKVFVIENEIGLKVQTEALTDNTKYKMSAGIAYINRSGNTDYDLKGRIVGGSDFTILGENIEHNNIKGDINFDVEQENGIFYNLNLSAEYGEKERTTYKAQLGLGYKF